MKYILWAILKIVAWTLAISIWVVVTIMDKFVDLSNWCENTATGLDINYDKLNPLSDTSGTLDEEERE